MNRATQFGDKLFGGVTGITPALAPQIAAQALRVLCPVRESMGEGGVVALGIAKGFEGRHLDSVESFRVIGTIAAMQRLGCTLAKKRSARPYRLRRFNTY
jgi:hypothetical protein